MTNFFKGLASVGLLASWYQGRIAMQRSLAELGAAYSVLLKELQETIRQRDEAIRLMNLVDRGHPDIESFMNWIEK